MNIPVTRIIIICEGQTEKEFCTDVLEPFFSKKGIYIQSPLIKKSGGGIVPWGVLKKQIENHLKQDSTAKVTLLIDYYGIKAKHEFPKWIDAQNIANKSERINSLETAMNESIEAALSDRFIPNIQLHEFEGLLFSKREVFENNFEEREFTDIRAFNKIFSDYPNPEDINDGATTAPSKRLKYQIKGYDKVVYGAILAEETGLTNIRNKCPRFNVWIEKLENCKGIANN